MVWPAPFTHHVIGISFILTHVSLGFMAVFSCYLFEIIWREVSSIAVEEYYDAFVSSKNCFSHCFFIHEKKVLAASLPDKGRLESGSDTDTHNSVNTVLERVHLLILLNLKAEHPSVSLLP